jgi:hypothetical protein
MIKKTPYFLLVFFIVLLILIPLFIKVKIECKSQFGECPLEINSVLLALKPKNLFDGRQKASSYLKKNFLISDFSTQFKLPNIMLINIIIKKPYFALKDSSSGKFVLVDTKGIILAVADSSNLPTVTTSEPLKKVGEKVDSSDLFALNLISGIYQMYQVGYGTIANDALVVDMTTGVRVIFPLKDGEEPEILLGGFRLIYTKVMTNYVGVYSQIDMRYKNPVLR